MKELVEYLIDNKKTISTMESCTGGFIASEITNIEGSSEVIKFSAVTYSNEYKIKMGVDKNIIDKHSVYSMETAKDMSLKIAEFTNSSYGVGVTGKINRKDENNEYGNDNEIFISIYDKEKDEYYTKKMIVQAKERKECKKDICNEVIEVFKNMVMYD